MIVRNFKIYYVLVMLLVASTFMACGDDEEPTIEQNIVNIASADADLTSLVAALTEADLVGTLNGDGPFTVFAPSDAAFQDLLDSNADWTTLADIPKATLTNVLLFHVLSGEVAAADLSDTYVNSLSTGPNDEPISLQVEVTGGVEFNGDATPTATDIDATNGIIHKVDKVMLPPSVVNLALNNAAFTSLVAALTDTRHTTDFVSVLSGDGPFTVFAPTNDAFQALLDSDATWNSLADVPIATLDAVLKYHVVGSANVQSDQLSDDQEVEMLSGGMTTIDLSDGAKIETSSGQSINIIITDVQGANGVVHAIDAVMLPL